MLRACVFEAHPRAAVADLLDHEVAAAGMDLREAGIQQSFDARDVEHGCCRSVTCHAADVQLLSFGIITGPFYLVTRDRQTRNTPMQQALRLVIAALRGDRSRAVFVVCVRAIRGQAGQANREACRGFIAAQKDMEGFAEKLQGGAPTSPIPRCRPSSRASPRSTASQASPNTTTWPPPSPTIMAGIDPPTKVFSDPTVAIKKEMEEVTGRQDDPGEREEADAGRPQRGAEGRRSPSSSRPTSSW